MAFTQWLPVRFGDLDLSRSVYFPKLLEYCHHTFEDFFTQEVGLPYAVVLEERRLGFQPVRVEADLRSPLRYGETCRVVMSTVGLGERSIACGYRLDAGDGERLCGEARIVTASVSLETGESVPIPHDIRIAFERHLARDTG